MNPRLAIALAAGAVSFVALSLYAADCFAMALKHLKGDY